MQCSPRNDQTPSLRNPEPDLLKNIPWVLLRPVQIRFIQGGFPSLDIGFGGIYKFCTLKDLPEEKQDEVNWYADVRGDEVVGSPRSKCIESVEEDDY